MSKEKTKSSKRTKKEIEVSVVNGYKIESEILENTINALNEIKLFNKLPCEVFCYYHGYIVQNILNILTKISYIEDQDLNSVNGNIKIVLYNKERELIYDNINNLKLNILNNYNNFLENFEEVGTDITYNNEDESIINLISDLKFILSVSFRFSNLLDLEQKLNDC